MWCICPVAELDNHFAKNPDDPHSGSCAATRRPLSQATSGRPVELTPISFPEAGAAYRFVVRCYNDVGPSEWSDPSEDIVTLPTTPNQCEPPFLADEADADSSWLRVSWREPHDNGADITHYTLLWTTNPRWQGASSWGRLGGVPSLR